MSNRPSKKVIVPHQQPPLQQQGSRVSSITLQARASFEGPLPPPQILQQYNIATPDAADRIIAMAERQSEHRERIEWEVVQSNTQSQKYGTHYAFVLAAIVLLGGLYCIAQGKSVAGFSLVAGDATTLAGTFLYSKSQQKAEREAKSKALAKQTDGDQS